MLDFYAFLYLTYQDLFRPQRRPKVKHAGLSPIHSDVAATRLGNAYRGSGVLVGILGALIIFCSVAPVGFGVLHHQSAIYFGIAEVALMIWVLVTIHSVRKQQLKERWIQTRKDAEIERYARLKQSTTGDLSDLQAAAEPLLGGENCQIEYNRTKYAQYHAIEHSAERATRIGFGMSLLAATLHLVVHADALIFLTAFLPAAVGALHGINAFLRLEQLANDHLEMANELAISKGAFNQALVAGDIVVARSIVESVYGLLTQGHQGWVSVANRLEVRAP